MTQTIQIFLVGPHRLYLDCLALALAAKGLVPMMAVGRVSELEQQALAAHPHGFVVVDVGVTKHTGVGWISRLTRGTSPVKVLALGAEEEQQGILDCIEAGATGAHFKEEPLESLVGCIEGMRGGEPACPHSLFPSLLARLAANGSGHAPADDPGLTLRERDIHALLADGLSNKQIATRLNISLHTVKNHVHRVLEKLQAEDRIEIVKRSRPGPSDARKR
jgi:DNA-binding NarL/FixJ family response regulator